MNKKIDFVDLQDEDNNHLVCESCGFKLVEIKCKAVCPRCGYFRSCSDLF